MNDLTNLGRAGFAGKAIRAFRIATRSDLDDSLCDLLGDLMHWADAKGYNFDAELERARWHYEAEVVEEQEVEQ